MMGWWWWWRTLSAHRMADPAPQHPCHKKQQTLYRHLCSFVNLLLVLCPLRLHHLSKSYDQAYSWEKGSPYILYTRFINVNRARTPPNKHQPMKAPHRARASHSYSPSGWRCRSKFQSDIYGHVYLRNTIPRPTDTACPTMANASSTVATTYVSLAPSAGNWAATAATKSTYLVSTVITWAPTTAAHMASMVLTAAGRSLTTVFQVAGLVTITRAWAAANTWGLHHVAVVRAISLDDSMLFNSLAAVQRHVHPRYMLSSALGITSYLWKILCT